MATRDRFLEESKAYFPEDISELTIDYLGEPTHLEQLLQTQFHIERGLRQRAQEIFEYLDARSTSGTLYLEEEKITKDVRAARRRATRIEATLEHVALWRERKAVYGEAVVSSRKTVDMRDVQIQHFVRKILGLRGVFPVEVSDLINAYILDKRDYVDALLQERFEQAPKEMSGLVREYDQM